MRKFLLIMISLICLSLLVGCGGKNNNDNNNVTPGTSATLGTSSAVNDGVNSVVTDDTNIIQGGVSMVESGMDNVMDGVESGISDAEDAMEPKGRNRR